MRSSNLFRSGMLGWPTWKGARKVGRPPKTAKSPTRVFSDFIVYFPDDSRRNAISEHAVRQIFDNNSACAHSCAGANHNAVANDGADSNPGFPPDANSAAEVAAGSDMSTVFDNAIMIHAG